MKKKQSSPFTSLVILVIMLVYLWNSCERTIEYLFIRTPPSLLKFRTVWERDPQGLVLAAVFLVLCVVTVITFFSLFGRKGSKRAAASPAPAASARDSRTRGGPAEKHESDEAIHCAHLRGREKYLEQIDNYLKTGLIDRSEYRVLKERYMRLDIADDYH
jgi:hypothetical protein